MLSGVPVTSLSATVKPDDPTAIPAPATTTAFFRTSQPSAGGNRTCQPDADAAAAQHRVAGRAVA